jgi:hypothetical protein
MGYYKTSHLELETPEPGNSPNITNDLKKLAEKIDVSVRALVEVMYGRISETGVIEDSVAGKEGGWELKNEGERYRIVFLTERSNANYMVVVTPEVEGPRHAVTERTTKGFLISFITTTGVITKCSFSFAVLNPTL